MKQKTPHHHHEQISRRLKRADGHLRSIIQMIEDERPCVDIAQQLFAVEKAISQAKRTLIQDHIDHCLEYSLNAADKHGKELPASSLEEFKQIAKYL